jgi:hypothetical protein
VGNTVVTRKAGPSARLNHTCDKDRWPGARGKRSALCEQGAVNPTLFPESSSEFNANASSKNSIRSNPAVDSPAIVSDLESFAADGLDYVQILGTPHLTEDYVADGES